MSEGLLVQDNDFLTVEDLAQLVPWQPWSGWEPFTFEKLKAIVKFRVERVGDETFRVAYDAVQADEQLRKQVKKEKRRGQADFPRQEQRP